MTTAPELIADPARITADWLTAALRASGTAGDASVTDVRRERTGTGLVGQSVRFTLTWDRAAAGLPATVVGKFPAPDGKSRERGRTGGEYEREIRFYSDLAARAGVRVPGCHLAAYDTETADFTLLLDDLAPARQGDQLTGCDVGQARDEAAQHVVGHRQQHEVRSRHRRAQMAQRLDVAAQAEVGRRHAALRGGRRAR